MGEETFADVKLMSNDQLADKLRVGRDEVLRLEEEDSARRAESESSGPAAG